MNMYQSVKWFVLDVVLGLITVIGGACVLVFLLLQLYHVAASIYFPYCECVHCPNYETNKQRALWINSYLEIGVSYLKRVGAWQYVGRLFV